MLDFHQLAEPFAHLQAEGRPYVVATVVRIGGSTYRRPGARMLVDAHGQTWGAISGGCLEADIAQQARAVLKTGVPMVCSFTLHEDDLVFGFGTGCNGIVEVLLEVVHPEDSIHPLAWIQQCVENRCLGVMGTVMAGQGRLEDQLARHVLVDGSSPQGNQREAWWWNRAVEDAETLRLQAATDLRPAATWTTCHYETEGGAAEVLFELIRPPIRVVVCGEGHDVQPLAQLARRMGWAVEVVGRKPAQVLQRRFPEATAWTFVMHPEDLTQHVRFDAFTAAVVMNHTYVRDRDMLEVLVRQTDLPYVGVLGPKERTANMVQECESRHAFTKQEHARIFGPIGLDIGTEAPHEIALSVAAEIQAALNDRPGGFLRDREAPIHGPRADWVGDASVTPDPVS